MPALPGLPGNSPISATPARRAPCVRRRIWARWPIRSAFPATPLKRPLQKSRQRARAGGPIVSGRVFGPDTALAAPFIAVKVTGALFHTQGGLETDGAGRVSRIDGGFLPNLRAAGGAACGVSGTGDSGYLSGNGLLAAIVMGRAAGASP